MIVDVCLVVTGIGVFLESGVSVCIVVMEACDCGVARDTCACVLEVCIVEVECLELDFSSVGTSESDEAQFLLSVLILWGGIRSVLICAKGLLSFVGFKENLVESKFFSTMSVTLTSDIVVEVRFSSSL